LHIVRRYFSRFSEPNAIDYLLIGNEVDRRYRRLIVTVHSVCTNIKDRVIALCPDVAEACTHTLPAVYAPTHWQVHCNLLRTLRLQQSDHAKRVAGFASANSHHDDDSTEKYIANVAAKRGWLTSANTDASSDQPSSEQTPSREEILAGLRSEFAELMVETQAAAQRIGDQAALLVHGAHPQAHAQTHADTSESQPAANGSISNSNSHKNACVNIKQVALRAFWVECVYPAQAVRLNDLCKHLQQYLIKHASLDATEAGTMALTLRTGMLRNYEHTGAGASSSSSSAAVASTNILVSASVFGRLFRFVDPNNDDIVEVCNLLIAFISNNVRWNVPPFPTSLHGHSFAAQLNTTSADAMSGEATVPPKVFFSHTEKDALLEMLTNSTGFVAINGPTRVGKTTRLLSLIHSGALLPPASQPSTASASTKASLSSDGQSKSRRICRDVCYIDLARVYADTDAVTRIAAELNINLSTHTGNPQPAPSSANKKRTEQLQPLQPYSAAELMHRVREYVSALRPNALVIVDNVSVCAQTNARREDNKSLSASGQNKNHNSSKDTNSPSARYLSLLSQFFAVLNEFVEEKSVCVCVVSSQLQPLTEAADFKCVYTVHPLPKDVVTQLVQSVSNIYSKVLHYVSRRLCSE
jgi:hypothetical protein